MTERGYASLEEVGAALEAAADDPVGMLEIVSLRCPSGFHGEVINGRFLRRPCNGSFCRIKGQRHTDHLFDLVTGQFRPVDADREMHTRRRRNAKPREGGRDELRSNCTRSG